MKLMFLDPKRPLPTCASTDCEDCPVQSRLHCHFNGQDLVRFLAIAFPPFIVGGLGIVRLNAWLLIPWVVLFFSYFGLVEIRVMCSHCPHYAEAGTKSIQCWANYGSPKLWQYRPGPMTRGEKFVFYAGLVLIAGYPLALLIASAQWLLLALFIVLVVAMGTAMRFTMCNQCMNFACPLNQVEPGVRAIFFARNPRVARAWKSASKQ